MGQDLGDGPVLEIRPESDLLTWEWAVASSSSRKNLSDSTKIHQELLSWYCPTYCKRQCSLVCMSL